MAVDSTGTLTDAGHTTMKKWAKDLVDLFPLTTSSNRPLDEVTRVEVIQFWAKGIFKKDARSQAVVDIKLGNYNNKEDLKNKIDNLRYNGSGNTLISHALALLNREIPNPPPRNTYVLVLTDGRDDSTPQNRPLASDPKPRTLNEEARILHAKNDVQVMAIGFRDYYRPNLTIIASSGEDNVIIDRDLGNALNRTYNKLITDLCLNSGNVLRPTIGEFNRCVGE